MFMIYAFFDKAVGQISLPNKGLLKPNRVDIFKQGSIS